MSSVVFHRLDRDRVVRRLKEYARGEVAQRSEVREVILVGSLARGDWSARSDADLVIVVDRSDTPWRSRAEAYLPSRRVGVPVDVLVYTADEAAAWSPRFRGEVERGIVLYRRQEAATGPGRDHSVEPG
jgi:predicted nucleotidyltransferase